METSSLKRIVNKYTETSLIIRILIGMAIGVVLALAVPQFTGIKILGSGCSKCRQLEKSTRQAIQELDLDLNVEHITDFTQIASYGVMSTPALVVNGKVVSFGKVLSVEEVKSILKEI